MKNHIHITLNWIYKSETENKKKHFCNVLLPVFVCNLNKKLWNDLQKQNSPEVGLELNYIPLNFGDLDLDLDRGIF